MYVNLPAPKCGKCGSKWSESFVRGGEYHATEQGIRCLNCGHEVIKAERKPDGMQWKWEKTEKDNVF